MADLSITAANVLAGSNAQTADGTAGATLTAGQPLYEDTTDSNKLKAADANASLATATLKGIALHAALSGQPIKYQTAGNLALGAIMTKGTWYTLSATAGGIAPISDLATGWYRSLIGLATTTSNLELHITNGGVTD